MGPIDFLECFIALGFLIYLYDINNKSFYNTMHKKEEKNGPKWSWAKMVWAEMVMGRNDPELIV